MSGVRGWKRVGNVARLAAAAALVCGLADAQTLTTKLVVSGLDRPVQAVTPPGDLERLFVVEHKTGLIRIVRDGAIVPTPFLDLSAKITNTWQLGAFSIAFHPDYATNGYFYVYYIDLNLDSVLERYTVSADPDVADPASASIVLAVLQPHDIHNGGMAAFGPDGYLYWALGDGGPQFDPNCMAQEPSSPLGKMLRIDVDGGTPYAVPPSNPFVSVPGTMDEIWALGLRNPWRFSWDELTGDFFLSDVGQNTMEEVNVEPAGFAGGANYGWSVEEGTGCHTTTSCPGTYPACGDPSYTAPVFAYAHVGLLCSITGGFVYRGDGLPSLYGRYLYADWCSGQIESFRYVGGAAVDFVDHTLELGGGTTIARTVTFASDGYGEPYLIDHYDGELFKIIPANGVSFCTAGSSASGCQALLSASGTPSATAASGFDLSVAGVEGAKDGLFFFGTGGRQASSWGNGTSYKCVVSPVSRGGLLAGTGTPSMCDGSFTQDLNARWTARPAQNPGAAAVVQAQFWYRDAFNSSNQSTSLSDAIEFCVEP